MKKQNLMTKRVTLHETKEGYIVRYRVKGQKRRARVPVGFDPEDYRGLVQEQIDTTGDFNSEAVRTGSFTTLMDAFVAELHEKARRRLEGRYERRYTISPGRLKTKMVHINKYIRPYFAEFEIADIDDLEVDDFQNSLLDKLSANSVNAYMGTLSQFFDFLVKRKVLGISPMQHFDKVEVRQPDVGFVPTRDEVMSVYEAARTDRDKTMILFAAQTGARIGEITPLTWDKIQNDRVIIDCSADRGIISKQNKTGVKRTIPIDRELQERLRLMRILDTPFVFTKDNGTMFNSDDARRRILVPACKAAGVPKFGWHALRRFSINVWEESGLHPDVVQKLAGHQLGSSVTKARYRHVRDEAIVDSANVISLFG